MLLYCVFYGEKIVTICHNVAHCQEKIIQQHGSKNTARKKLFNSKVLKILTGKKYSTAQF